MFHILQPKASIPPSANNKHCINKIAIIAKKAALGPSNVAKSNPPAK